MDRGRTAVRQELDGDFCFAAHHLKYEFIPKNELWLDSAMSAEQVHYALAHEIEELRMMRSGEDYENAYPNALAVQLQERERQARLCQNHEARLETVSYGVRERGVRANPRRKR